MMIDSFWLSHKTLKTHKLLNLKPTTGGTYATFDTFNQNSKQIFHSRWYDEDLDKWVGSDYFFKTYDCDDYDDYFFKPIRI